jgi:hypothetical protein
MQLEPTLLDGAFEAGTILRRSALVAKQKRSVDLLGVDASLHWLDLVGDFEDVACGSIGMICDLATDQKKRETFDRLAAHLTSLADQVEQAMMEAGKPKRA